MVTESMTQSEHMLCLLEKELNVFHQTVRIIHLAHALGNPHFCEHGSHR
jgi:hypothetical protein